MKKCPYCFVDIDDDALKCRHCGESPGRKQRERWYFKTYWLVIAFLCLGPFALPLLWFNPRFKPRNKIILSVIVILLSYYLAVFTVKSIKTIGSYYRQMF